MVGKKKFYGCTGSLVPGSQFQRLARGQAVLRRLALWASFILSCFETVVKTQLGCCPDGDGCSQDNRVSPMFVDIGEHR